jgi:hypothetical protein
MKIKEPAAKRLKKVTVRLDLDKNLPSDVSVVMNPSSLKSVREWAIACGVAPEELSDETLLQGRNEEN